MAPREAQDLASLSSNDAITGDPSLIGSGRNEINVVVNGAGPAGLLTAIHLLRNNEKAQSTDPMYRVTLIDNNVDYGKLTVEELKAHHRSWMIGLSNNGINALKEVPDLFEKYVQPISVKLQKITLSVGKTKLAQISEEQIKGEQYVVDRNFVVAGMARYLRENFGKSPYLHFMPFTKVLFVDVEGRRVMTRSTEASQTSKTDFSTDQFVEYEILVGCDGIRSVARDGIAKSHRDFEFSLSDTFTFFKSIHIDRPPALEEGELPFFTNGIPGMIYGIGLPEMGNKLNVATGYYKDAECPVEMKSDNPKVVAEYLRKNFGPFELADYDDFAEQWVKQSWTTTGQVHCNFYHSNKCKILLLGDAAHATSPAIGMGMNTALEDAGVLLRLLAEYSHEWDEVMAAFSKERVKVGNALSDISVYTNSFDPIQAARIQITGVMRSSLKKLTGGLIMGDPLDDVGINGYSLADAYHDLVKMNRLPPVREYNDRRRREYFEKVTGMVKEDPPTPKLKTFIQLGATGLILAAVVAKLSFRKG